MRADDFAEGLVVTSMGVAVGFALSLLAGKVLASVLYKVSGTDPLGVSYGDRRAWSSFASRVLPAGATGLAGGSHGPLRYE